MRSEAWSLKHPRRMAFRFQLKASFPYRSCAKSLEEKDCNSLQKCGVMDVFLQRQLRCRGHGQVSWEESNCKCPSEGFWAIDSTLSCCPCLHLCLKEIEVHGFFFLPGCIDRPFKSTEQKRVQVSLYSKIVTASSWGRKGNESIPEISPF